MKKSVKDISISHDSPSTTIAAYEGDTSFGTQTLQADRTVACVLGSNSTVEIRSALSSLKDSLESHGTSTRVHEAYISPSALRHGPPDLTLPPVDLVAAVVRRIKGGLT